MLLQPAEDFEVLVSGASVMAIASMTRIGDVCKAAARLAKMLMESMEHEDV